MFCVFAVSLSNSRQVQTEATPQESTSHRGKLIRGQEKLSSSMSGSETPASLLLLWPQKTLPSAAATVFFHWEDSSSSVCTFSSLTAVGLLPLRRSVQVVWIAVYLWNTWANRDLNYETNVTVFLTTERMFGHSLMTFPICLDPLFSSSARTLVSNANDATRKKNSLTFSPTAQRRRRSVRDGDWMIGAGKQGETCLHSNNLPVSDETAQYSALICCASLMASCSIWEYWAGDCQRNKTQKKLN